jgi:beta-mannosidase
MPSLSFSLDGEWQLVHFPEGEYAICHPDDLPKTGLTPLAARVPGNVEVDLQRAGLLPDPFYADAIHALRPLETHEWWYRRTFFVPESWAGWRVQLVCDGLDTLATVWVNGEQVGQAANMLIPHRFEVGQALHAGQENVIAVRLSSAFNAARRFDYDANTMSWEHRAEGLYLRKAPHVWGWDILPRAVSAGIWRSVWLESVSANAIEQLYCWTVEVTPEGATLGVWFQVRSDAPTLDEFSLHFRGECNDHCFEYEWPLEFEVDHCAIPVPGAKLWWPRGYGEPNLYTLTVQLRHAGESLAERVERIGLRRIVLARSEVAGPAWSPEAAAQRLSRLDRPPLPETHFFFSVNGEPIMVKGTNWVPLDAFHSRDIERLETALALAKDLGCNMIRCWGGNVYESDAFFEACDREGILVWQDFAFACCCYPQTEEFLTQVRQEVEAVVRRLRNHASLAVWCGDNEIDQVYLAQGLNPAHNRLTREVIPQALRRCDPQRSYLPSSPYLSPSLTSDGQPPEQHLWGPRGYFKSSFYTHHSAHFIGEIGYHGCPHPASLQKFISPERLWPWQENAEWRAHDVYHWQHHAVDRDRIRLMANQIRELFGSIPEDLESFALASQITQAEAKKYFIESTRLRKWRTAGILWWNLLDGWPQFSDAVVDYYFVKKLAYHYIWRVQRPIGVIIGEAGTGKYLPLVISNDSLRTAKVSYRVWDADSGEVVAADDFMVPGNQNWQVERIRTYASEQRLYLMTWEVEGQRYGNHYLVGAPPFSLGRYRAWLPQIAALPPVFTVFESRPAFQQPTPP